MSHYRAWSRVLRVSFGRDVPLRNGWNVFSCSLKRHILSYIGRREQLRISLASLVSYNSSAKTLSSDKHRLFLRLHQTGSRPSSKCIVSLQLDELFGKQCFLPETNALANRSFLGGCLPLTLPKACRFKFSLQMKETSRIWHTKCKRGLLSTFGTKLKRRRQ